MTAWSCVHLIFCEGPHDVAFLSQLLKTIPGTEKTNLTISKLPYPLADVMKKSFETRAAEDLRLDLAKKFFLPDCLFAQDSRLIIVFNYGGSNRKNSMSSFLANVFALLEATPFSRTGETINIPTYKYTVFADADAAGVADALKEIREDLGLIDKKTWLGSEWIAYHNTKAKTQETHTGSAAAYIWAKWDKEVGTLEDIVLECVSNNEGLEKTLQFLDSRFDWKPPAGASAEQTHAAAAKRLKAALCVEGQREKPGGSLGVILDQADLLAVSAMEASRAAQDCLTFLRNWLA